MRNEEKIPYVVTGKSFTAVAVNCAAKAGEWIKSRLGQFKKLSIKSSMHDLVTEVDKGAEVMIRKLIMTHFPHHEILGEESVEPGRDASQRALEQAQKAEYLWIIDPLDGTTNFVHGFPYFSVSIALAHKGEVIVGVVYDPIRDELFVAEKGKGAYVHGAPMEVAKETELSDSLIASGFPTERERALPLNLAGIQALAPQVRNIRTSGSAALHMAYVAAGRLTGFWELNLNAWDLAAGSLLIAESGGRLTDTHGNPYHLAVRDIVGTNGHIHDAMIHVLKEAKAQG
ncbi:inositol monophosphatase [Paenibacillus sp. ACRRX]|uniref:inositol monophosphatase family protein n=1 Tax=unclassified Paenibacillus TaxID=185978 RepID=UPI001EF42D52|nr:MULTISPECIES: inositol monophosphatase family protein [unclassified Paenibacillus]MCG7408479.1 inositol monophosphatase [Paenibacillus sp. ACRRX]MDK8182717.1 inositol monophosphatase family protein [Paenibacillus sp. UMB4589-SE434]